MNQSNYMTEHPLLTVSIAFKYKIAIFRNHQLVVLQKRILTQ